MAEKITFGDRRRILEHCGFDRTARTSPFVVYKHGDSGALQAFRAHQTRELADPMTLASVRKTIAGFGFMEENEFESAIREAAAER